MSDDAARQFIATRLQAVLRLLALEPGQIDVDSVREIGRPAALARDFAEYHTIAKAQFGAAMTAAQRASLERIAQQFAAMSPSSPGSWGERAVLHDAEWATVRVAAQKALQAFGWTSLPVDPRVAVEQARWVRCAREGLWLGPGVWAAWMLVVGAIDSGLVDSPFVRLMAFLSMLPVLPSQVASAVLFAQAAPAWRLRPVPFPVRALGAFWLIGPLLLLFVPLRLFLALFDFRGD